MLGSLLLLHRRIPLLSLNNDGEISYEHLTKMQTLTCSLERLLGLLNAIGDFLSTCRPLEEIDSTESAVWIQTGLALPVSRLCYTTHV